MSGRTAGSVTGPQRIIMSMTRLARDPYMLLCYIRSCQMELVGMTPKVSNNRVLLTAMRVFVRNLEENARGRFIADTTEDFR